VSSGKRHLLEGLRDLPALVVGQRHEELHVLEELDVHVEFLRAQSGDDAPEGESVDHPDDRVLVGDDRGGAGTVVHERQLAEHGAFAPHGNFALVDEHVELATSDDVQAVAKVALLDSGLASLDGRHPHLRDDLRLVLRVQVHEDDVVLHHVADHVHGSVVLVADGVRRGARARGALGRGATARAALHLLGAHGRALRELHVQARLAKQSLEVVALQVEGRHVARGVDGRAALRVVDQSSLACAIRLVRRRIKTAAQTAIRECEVKHAMRWTHTKHRAEQRRQCGRASGADRRSLTTTAQDETQHDAVSPGSYGSPDVAKAAAASPHSMRAHQWALWLAALR
jgi:hypothetical protein